MVKFLGVELKEYKALLPEFGFTEQAERWNGRVAMVGFVTAITSELVSGHSWFIHSAAGQSFEQLTLWTVTN
eukprot:g47563.t1